MKLILFDLDGTLFRTESVDVSAFNRALEANGLKKASKERILSLVGLTLEDFCKELTESDDRALLDKVKADVIRFEMEEIEASGELYPGVEKFLKGLKSYGCILCICSNGSEEYISAISDKFNLSSYFEEIWFSKEGITKSQAAGILKKKFNQDSFLMVGDRLCDYEAARENSGISIGVTYGYGGNEPESADYKADSISGLEELILKLIQDNK